MVMGDTAFLYFVKFYWTWQGPQCEPKRTTGCCLSRGKRNHGVLSIPWLARDPAPSRRSEAWGLVAKHLAAWVP